MSNPLPPDEPGEAAAGGLSDPLFFGALEGICFLCLFASPILSPDRPLLVWLATVLLRTIVLAAVCLPTRYARGKSPSLVGRFLTRGWLYQAPFWISALLFPLQTGQGRHALTALSVQCVLTALLPLLSLRAKRFGAESVVYLVSLGWLLCWRQPGWWLAGAVIAFAATWRGGAAPPAWGWVLTNGQALALGMGWLAAFALPPLSRPSMVPLQATLLCWLLLIYVGAVMSTLQAESLTNAEVEEATPCLGAAQVWLLARRGVVSLVGWAALLALVVNRPQEAVALLLLLTAWWRGLAMAARGWFNPDRVVWWAAFEITLIWAAIRSELGEAAGLLLLSVLFAAWVRWERGFIPNVEGILWQPGTASLEQALVLGLYVQAPRDFARKVLIEDTGSAELDANLTSAAPAGFRDRLLERLRQTAAQEGGEQEGTE